MAILFTGALLFGFDTAIVRLTVDGWRLAVGRK